MSTDTEKTYDWTYGSYTEVTDTPKEGVETAPVLIIKKSWKEKVLDFAEVTDGLRIVPRIFLLMYGIAVSLIITWYMGLETFVQEKCDPALIQVLIDNAQTIEEAKLLACHVAAVVGGPTPEQTAFVTVVIGLAAAVFGFYTNTGRKWIDKIKSSTDR